MWSKMKEIKLLGFSMPFYLIMVIVFVVISMTGSMMSSFVGALGFALLVGTLIGWIGDRIPIWKDWLGGGMLLSSIATSAFVMWNIIPQESADILSTFNNDMGFLDLYILVLITGAILSIDRKLLIRAFAGFIPAILGAVVVSAIFTAIGAIVCGQSPLEAQMTVMLPIMGGGNGAGCIPMSRMWGEVTGRDPQEWYAPAFAIMSLGNLVSVFSAAMLDRIGKKWPSLTGNGVMMKGNADVKGAEDPKDVKIGVSEYASGLALALFLYCLADFYASKISIINNVLDLGFSIHKFAFMVIFAAIANGLGLVPIEIRSGARGMQQFFANYMSFPLMVAIGAGTNLMDYVEAFTIPNLVMIIACVLGAMVGAVLIGSTFFKFYPVEIAITAGLDMAGGGGSGDVQILGASHRMELMSFAQISSRIGGAIMLIIASVLFGML